MQLVSDMATTTPTPTTTTTTTTTTTAVTITVCVLQGLIIGFSSKLTALESDVLNMHDVT